MKETGRWEIFGFISKIYKKPFKTQYEHNNPVKKVDKRFEQTFHQKKYTNDH